MNESKLLARLSELVGILPAYTDNWQQQHATPPATQRMLLAAMGFDVSSPEKLAAAIDEREQRSWLRLLEPVVVIRASTPWVRIVMQDGVADEEWRSFLAFLQIPCYGKGGKDFRYRLLLAIFLIAVY